MTVGGLIAKFREEHHMSQRKFALLCGLSNGYISMIEKNLNPQTGRPPEISPEALKSIAETMGMTMDELARKVDPETKIYRRVNPLEGLETISVPIDFPLPERDEQGHSSIVSTEPWDTDEAFADKKENPIYLMARGMSRLNSENQQKLLNVAKTLFGDDFTEEGDKK